MTKLQQWMTKQRLKDHQVARSIRLSRPQVSRLRRGLTGAKRATAIRLQALTGIKWWHFMEAPNRQKRR